MVYPMVTSQVQHLVPQPPQPPLTPQTDDTDNGVHLALMVLTHRKLLC